MRRWERSCSVRCDDAFLEDLSSAVGYEDLRVVRLQFGPLFHSFRTAESRDAKMGCSSPGSRACVKQEAGKPRMTTLVPGTSHFDGSNGGLRHSYPLKGA